MSTVRPTLRPSWPAPPALSEEHAEALARYEYLACLNASEAARRAGYSTNRPDQAGYENLRKPEIAAAVAVGAWLLIAFDQQALAAWGIFIGLIVAIALPLDAGPHLRLARRPRRRTPTRRRRSSTRARS